MWPPLPNELLDMLADHIVAECDDERARIVTGKRMSLVCTQLVGLGRRVLWRSKRLTCSDQNLLMARELAKRPDLVSYLRELSFVQAEGSSTSVQWVNTMVEIAKGCSGALKSFACYPALSPSADDILTVTRRDWLSGLADSIMAPGLKNLMIRTALGPDLVAADLASELSRFGRLDALHLAVDFGRSPTAGLSQIVEANKLVSIHLDAATTATDCALCRALPVFVAAVADLPHLKHVHLGNEPLADDAGLHKSPVALDVVLASLPPSVETYKVEGVYFANNLDLRFFEFIEYKRAIDRFDPIGWVQLRLEHEYAQFDLAMFDLRRLIQPNGNKHWGLYNSDDS
ncbi:hypothetical protein JCM9279_003949 [Rhodotorula babjevae]